MYLIQYGNIINVYEDRSLRFETGINICGLVNYLCT